MAHRRRYVATLVGMFLRGPNHEDATRKPG
jgi:hypothetical protein